MRLMLKTGMKLAAGALLLAGGCKPQNGDSETRNRETGKTSPQQTRFPKTSLSVAAEDLEFNKVQTIIASSCMPCHNRQTLPEVIALTEKGKFKAIGDDTRLRILGELGDLHDLMQSGMPISFTSKEELHKFFGATAGEFYLMLEKGRMPPPWAPELMRQIHWPKYQKLSSENRFELMKYAKPYTEKFLR